jgi:hypothetical protein
MAGRSSISRVSTTEIDAGASRIFSSRRDAVTTAGLSCVTISVMRTSSCAVCPSLTWTPAIRRTEKPSRVTFTV